MYREFQDEIINGTPKYNITDNPDNTKDISLANAVVNPGTPLNRATFQNLQGDLYTSAQYSTPTYSGNNMALNLPLTSYETGKIVRIKAPTTFAVHPTININQLGAKTVNAVLAQGVCYDLIYNGTSFDVNIANGSSVDKYYPITSTIETITGNPVPTTGWSRSDIRLYTNGDFKLRSDLMEKSSSYPLTNILLDDSSYWEPYAEAQNVEFIIELDYAMEITKFYLHFYGGNYSRKTWTIYGSNDSNNWDELYSAYETTMTKSETATLTSTGNYKLYRLYIHGNTTMEWKAYRFYPTEYKKPKSILNIPISAYEENMMVRIKSDANLINPAININNLGDKQINAPLSQGAYYTLLYNGTSFDLILKDYVIGTYTADDELYQFINLGFTPKAVLVLPKVGQLDDNYYGGLAVYDSPSTYGIDNKNIEIVTNGFNVYRYANSKGANSSGSSLDPHRYIAFE